MFLGSDDEGSLGDIYDRLKGQRTRVQGEECDFCGSSEGSMIHDREEDVVRCKTCYNDPETYDNDG